MDFFDKENKSALALLKVCKLLKNNEDWYVRLLRAY